MGQEIKGRDIVTEAAPRQTTAAGSGVGISLERNYLDAMLFSVSG